MGLISFTADIVQIQNKLYSKEVRFPITINYNNDMSLINKPKQFALWKNRILNQKFNIYVKLMKKLQILNK